MPPKVAPNVIMPLNPHRLIVVLPIQEPFLLHELCSLATRKDVQECIDLLVTMGRNRRVLWLVSSLTKVEFHTLYKPTNLFCPSPVGPPALA